MIVTTKRPRNVDAPRAAALLYGDLGTSKAYVLGLAFAAAGYSSFWLIAAMACLTALVGINYIAICRHYPDGGGVYASVRHRSEILAIVGAFLLIADYTVTAAISALSAFHYLGAPHPALFAAGAIALIGGLNYFGPRHTGGLALLVSLPTALAVVALGIFSVPHLGQAAHNLQPLQGGFWHNWKGFVSIVLALSGIEAVANTTGVMKLDPGSSDTHPAVEKTAAKAIAWVLLEVCFFTALLGLAMHALNGLTAINGEVNAPGNPGVRDYMLRYMAEVFVGKSVSLTLGQAAGVVVSVVFGALLLSAVNTAIVGLIAVQFLMSRDRELPPAFEKLNGFGVPTLSATVATVVPVFLVLFVGDVAGLADLYAVGVVGAIACNLGACSTDKKLGLARWERNLMFPTFLLMLAIEVSLFIDKPNARVFAMTMLAVGLFLRGLVQERARAREAEAGPVLPMTPVAAEQGAAVSNARPPTGSSLLCAVRGIGRTLDYALEEARESNRPLYLLYIREQPAIMPEDQGRRWQEDAQASAIFNYAKKQAPGLTILNCYAVSDSPADTIVETAATIGASRLLLGAPRRGSLITFLRGDIIRRVIDNLPENIHLLVYA